MSEHVKAPTSKLNVVLWVIQILLGLLFIWAGALKLVMRPEDMQGGPVSFPTWFLRFIGVCELLGGLGLILPGLLRVKPGLAPLAAACLVIIMIGATAVSLGGPLVYATIPLVCGLLLAFVAYGRWRIAPHRSRA